MYADACTCHKITRPWMGTSVSQRFADEDLRSLLSASSTLARLMAKSVWDLFPGVFFPGKVLLALRNRTTIPKIAAFWSPVCTDFPCWCFA